MPADTKISALTANASPALEDLIPTVDDPSGTPVTKSATLTLIDALFRANSLQAVATASATLASSDAETSIVPTVSGSMTLAAGYFGSAGKSIHVRVMGVISNTSTPTLRIRMKLGSVTVIDSTAVTTPSSLSNHIFIADAYITCRTTGATGTVFAQGHLQTGGSFFGMPNTAASSAIDLTGTLLLAVTGQWGSLSASNTLTVTHLFVEKLN